MTTSQPAALRSLRRRLRLTQAAFADAYRLPVGTVRDWEQGRAKPDAAAAAFLAAIEALPSDIRSALAKKTAQPSTVVKRNVAAPLDPARPAVSDAEIRARLDAITARMEAMSAPGS